MPEPDWKQFEVLVASVQRELAPGSEVRHNEKIVGRRSKVPRQIDIAIHGKVGQYEMLIVIDCKDHATPLDVKGVEDFMGLVEDVGAQQGAMVAAKGYTEAAMNRAKDAGINLYRLVDTDAHKWRARVTMPMLCDFRAAKFALRLSMSGPHPFRLGGHPVELEVFDLEGNTLGIAGEILTAKWNGGDLPSAVGEHQDVDFLGQPIQADNGYGTLVPVSLTASLLVERRLYFGRVDIPKIRGFADVHDGGVITRGFTLAALDPQTIEKEWQRIEREEDAPAKPGIYIQALDCYGDSDE